MSARTVYTHKLTNRSSGVNFTPGDNVYRLGVASEPSKPKNNRITAGVYIGNPSGNEFSYYRNTAFRPLSSQGALFTARSVDPANPILASGAVGFVEYSHLIEHNDLPVTSITNPGQVRRTYLPSGKGTYILWIYVEYDSAREVDLAINNSGSYDLAAMSFPATTKFCSLSATYAKTTTAGEEIVWSYTTSPDLPRIIRTAIIKTGDIP